MPRPITLIGCPVDSGKAREGCLMGPDALRIAGLPEALRDLGYVVSDLGNCALPNPPLPGTRNTAERAQDTRDWTALLAQAAFDAAQNSIPIFLGGDHALSMGTGLGMAAYAAQQNRPLFVLWLDAHSDFHTPLTSSSGNLHGMPLGYLSGRAGFDGFPEVPNPIPEERICMIGLRSVDAAERKALQAGSARAHDMRAMDEHGIAALTRAFLNDVAAANGLLHVSFDTDFLDPTVAPAVGTTVPGGATLREGHLVMEMICDSGLMTSLDIVELNPALDEQNRTAQVLCDMAASALGRRIFDRPTPTRLH